MGASVDVKDAAADCQDASEFSFFSFKKRWKFFRNFRKFLKKCRKIFFSKRIFGRAKIGGKVFLSKLKLPKQAESQSPGIIVEEKNLKERPQNGPIQAMIHPVIVCNVSYKYCKLYKIY